MVPTVELPPATPFTCQFTAVLEDPVTVGVNAFVCPTVTFALVGLTDTETTGAAWIVTLAVAFFVVSACEIAFTVAVGVLGTLAGAVYTPEALMVPLVESPPATPFTCHVTLVLEVPVTVAVNACV